MSSSFSAESRNGSFNNLAQGSGSSCESYHEDRPGTATPSNKNNAAADKKKSQKKKHNKRNSSNKRYNEEDEMGDSMTRLLNEHPQFNFSSFQNQQQQRHNSGVSRKRGRTYIIIVRNLVLMSYSLF